MALPHCAYLTAWRDPFFVPPRLNPRTGLPLLRTTRRGYTPGLTPAPGTDESSTCSAPEPACPGRLNRKQRHGGNEEQGQQHASSGADLATSTSLSSSVTTVTDTTSCASPRALSSGQSSSCPGFTTSSTHQPTSDQGLDSTTITTATTTFTTSAAATAAASAASAPNGYTANANGTGEDGANGCDAVTAAGCDANGCDSEEEDEYMMLIGSGLEGLGGTALIYRSQDLARGWRFAGYLCTWPNLQVGFPWVHGLAANLLNLGPYQTLGPCLYMRKPQSAIILSGRVVGMRVTVLYQIWPLSTLWLCTGGQGQSCSMILNAARTLTFPSHLADRAVLGVPAPAAPAGPAPRPHTPGLHHGSPFPATCGSRGRRGLRPCHSPRGALSQGLPRGGPSQGR